MLEYKLLFNKYPKENNSRSSDAFRSDFAESNLNAAKFLLALCQTNQGAYIKAGLEKYYANLLTRTIFGIITICITKRNNRYLVRIARSSTNAHVARHCWFDWARFWCNNHSNVCIIRKKANSKCQYCASACRIFAFWRKSGSENSTSSVAWLVQTWYEFHESIDASNAILFWFQIDMDFGWIWQDDKARLG